MIRVLASARVFCLGPGPHRGFFLRCARLWKLRISMSDDCPTRIQLSGAGYEWLARSHAARLETPNLIRQSASPIAIS